MTRSTLVAGRIAAQAGFRRVILAGAVASFDLVRDADVVMLGGGGLLYDTADGGAPRAQNVAYYAGLLRHAQELGRATAVLGIGVQGIHTPLGRAAYAEVLRRAAHVSVRDPGDLQVLREELGVDRAVLAADLGFGLAPWVWPAVRRPGAAAGARRPRRAQRPHRGGGRCRLDRADPLPGAGAGGGDRPAHRRRPRALCPAGGDDRSAAGGADRPRRGPQRRALPPGRDGGHRALPRPDLRPAAWLPDAAGDDARAASRAG